ncbi:hypothetical protein GN958_ATG08883 [Phytophthora infestans]|uniref:Uncharacterized protein n=1 Tax=Phytophthora infestans TaxID=4787 RepID=A0A8S9USF7_PHYIN|nr:hypothetical protein GN958_ATG08883 [Phytophthora infestans]
MRWRSSGNGVGASAYTLASRDENASYYYYQEPLAPLTASAFGNPPSNPHPRVRVKKRQGRRIIGSNAHSKQRLKSSCFAVEENSPTSLESEPESTPLIVCAGKSVYGPITGEDRYKSTVNQRNDELDNPYRTITQTAIMELDTSPLHRTDEELEQIIRELRDQVFLKQNLEIVEKSTCQQNRRRKHLKNPIEKMEAVVSSKTPATISESTHGRALQRPLSSSQLHRLMAENALQIAVPAVIYDATVKSGGINSRATGNQISSLDFSTLRSRSRPNSSSTFRVREKPAQNPRDRPKPTSTSSQKGRECDDSGDGFLYLVDVDSDRDVESNALSPVGPWIVDGFSSILDETPRSPVSTCLSVSSLGGEDVDNNREGDELAAKSPRSRLLYFSACADNSETARCFPAQSRHPSLRRSATSRSSLISSSKLDSRAAKLKRCASANVSTRCKIRTSSASRDNPNKRPQSGGARSSRSSQSDEYTG